MLAADQPFWALAQPADQTAVVAGDGESWSYARLSVRADEAARMWYRGSKSLVLLLARNDLPTFAAYLGALRVGDPVIVVDPATPLAVLAAIVENYRPDAIVHPLDMADPLLDGYDVVATDLGLAVSAPEEFDVPAPHPDLAVVLASGDESGRFARLSRRNLASQAAVLASCFGLTAESRVIAALSPAECHGLAVVNALFQAGGAALAGERSVAAEGFWAFARAHGASLLAGSTYDLDLLDRMGFEPSRLPTLRTMLFAGLRLKAERLRRVDAAVRSAGVRLTTLAGGADATGGIAHVPPALTPGKLGALGIGLPGSSLSVDAATGTLHYAGPNVALGHAESRADLARGDVLRGRLTYEAIARADADGVLWPVAMRPQPPIDPVLLQQAGARP